MQLYITEKPSVGRDIARILGANRPGDGYIAGDGVCVTWTLGHLCCLKEPHDYTERWKRWSLGALPMIPARFGIKVIAERGIEHQFDVVSKLIAQADEVINCGDAGQEGELIQRWVMQKAGIKCPVRRLWISSLTDQAIREGLQKLRAEADYDNLYKAGLSRAIGDWLLGMNATRLYTLKYGMQGTVLSIGRVQTPTLALIVERHRQITEFKPEDFWELKTTYRDVTFNATSGRFMSVDDANAALESITGKDFTVTEVTEKKGRESAPRLFDLTSLQVECNRQWGWTADETLRLIQSLYEKKVTTYPRVDTTYLTNDMYNKVPEILGRLTPYADITAPVLAADRIPKSKKVFDDSKVTDHHAIIPTGESPSVLVGDERKMFHLIARRFIAVFYPDCVFNTTTVLGQVEKVGFKATGKVIVEPGWRAIYAKDKPVDTKEEGKEGDDEKILPPFTVGESGQHTPALVKKNTQPPKPYNEGSLLRAMESAGKMVDDEELREAMKENGIGRPSTRSAIIETLFRRKYLRRERKNIHPTEAGIALINTIRTEILKSAKLTGLWENKLRRIERGTFEAAEFINEIKTMVDQVVLTVLADNSAQRILTDQKATETNKKVGEAGKKGGEAAPKRKRNVTPSPKTFEEIACPVCGTGHLIKGNAAVGCSNFRNGCRFVIPFADLGKTVSAASVSRYLKKRAK